ncbi:asparagine synthase (glutamine-hydrolyzing) [Pajaroellobacter abortibovis]|uniref:asparagine synthase (glutamine-hydrolyzing) n=1 Tax=Pajaroellobacter abortibovis TaxID=1882918 RepID=A0A1L6MZ38_9BACT|nr:asparagine synthase (glutamine-hydrolyzing) [Pajaroellobacter abortibovis]APS00760.1 asparagine synthase (glutamine-hydrolyzing) [Pajaroellobacter abortibovis]
MCGLVGILDSYNQNEEELSVTINRMSYVLSHRGPDDSGSWVDLKAGVALGFRRLAILDLSSIGSQPMHSHCDRFVLSLNGEIYNFLDLKKELEQYGHRFNSRSDTEVVLACIAQWGVVEACKRFEGMFALACWDKRNQILCLARDRFGEKPLYYGWVGKCFVFASELKAFLCFPGFEKKISQHAVSLYFTYNYIPTPWSIYEGIYKLAPGTVLEMTAKSFPSARYDDFSRALKPYWSLREVVEDGIAHPFIGTEKEAEEELHHLLKRAVSKRMLSDVSVGAFLSGGIDSSLVVAYAQQMASSSLKAFSVGFHEQNYNEAPYAKRVACCLGAELIETYMTPQDMIRIAAKLPSLYDEPFADSSQLPTYLVAELARRHVVVSLSGDGGDELFAGYRHYQRAPFLRNLWCTFQIFPQGVRKCLSYLIDPVFLSVWKYGHSCFGLNSYWLNVSPEKLRKTAQLSILLRPQEIYGCLNGNVDIRIFMSFVVPNSITPIDHLETWPKGITPSEEMMYADASMYLVDDILVKIDRATMAHGLESRAPFLDRQLVEFGWRLPLAFKLKRGKGKLILRNLLSRYLPTRLVERPKMGFGTPIGMWLRGPMQEWVNDIIMSDRLNENEYLQAPQVRNLWKNYIQGKNRLDSFLWTILVFQLWLDRLSGKSIDSNSLRNTHFSSNSYKR